MLGSVTIDATVGAASIGVRFNDMDVQCPILSVRRLCADGNDVYLNHSGGYIENLSTEKRIPQDPKIQG